MFSKIAVIAVTVTLSGAARAGTHVDLEAVQQRAEQGQSPMGAGSAIPLAPEDRITSHELAEAAEQAETGMGYTPSWYAVPVPGGEPVHTSPRPVFGIGEAQQRAVTGAGYAPGSGSRATAE
jgi:hypothetical protein